MTSIKVRRLRADDDTAGFSCGDQGLDRFIRRYAYRNQDDFHLGVTYVAVPAGAEHIAGFITLASASLAPDELPRPSADKPRYPLPVVRIARLAVDERRQHQGIGRLLVRFAFSMAIAQAASVGCVGVTVDSLPKAVGFYEALGLEPLHVVAGESPVRPMTVPMYISITRLVAGHR